MPRTIAILAALSLVPGLCFCAGTTTVPIGSRVRVRMYELDRRISGVLVGVWADSIVVRPEGGSRELTLGFNKLEWLEVSRGMGRNWLPGGGVGLLAGGGLGALWGSTLEPGIAGRSGNIVVAAMLFGAAGLVIGAAVGGLTHVEKWKRVPRWAITPAGE